mmetsp:Transcript_736/g.1557  ORF Transcript_736/g.1557 Transcript_736/m.1557 type:complete len:769 (+) Transcript_736:86-2392(+)
MMRGLIGKDLLVGTLPLLVCAFLVVSSQANDNVPRTGRTEVVSSSLRGQQEAHRKLLRPDYPCILVRVEVEYEHVDVDDAGLFSDLTDIEQHDAGDEVRCELSDDDVAKADGQYFVSIVGIENSRLGQIESGVSTLVADGAVLMDGALQVPQGAAIEIGTINDMYADSESDEGDFVRWRSLRMRRANRRLSTSGVKKVLVIRADASDAKTTANSITLSNDIFGTAGDQFNLKSQYRQCSYEKLMFEPYDGGNGVIDVTLHETIVGRQRSEVERFMTKAATSMMGNLSDQFDHVMLCMPKGTGGWIAYAYVNSWLSVFNDDWCQQLSTQVHEIGHNMGLPHSGKGDSSYADKSGMMGFSYKEKDSPRQCFNPSKSYQLAWYGNSVVDWNPSSSGTWVGPVVGVVDYDENSSDQTTVIRIPRPRHGSDLYIGYNRAKGMNSEVRENGDKVTIIEKAEGYKVSKFIAGLQPGSIQTKEIFYNFEGQGRNLVIDFSRYGTSVDEAFVAIYFEDCAYPICCLGSMCKSVTPLQRTGAPTQRPTKTPTNTPTNTPTKRPSAPPVEIKTLEDPNISPIIVEVLPNPKRQEEEYIEIYNPHQEAINLADYFICIRNGRRNRAKCDKLINFNLDPNAYFMLCSSFDYVAESRTCHQVGSKLNFKNRRKQFVTLRKIKSSEEDTMIRTTTVDDVRVPKPFDYPYLAYVRKSGHMSRYCGSCWTWSTPASAAIETWSSPVSSARTFDYISEADVVAEAEAEDYMYTDFPAETFPPKNNV